MLTTKMLTKVNFPKNLTDNYFLDPNLSLGFTFAGLDVWLSRKEAHF